MSKAQTATEYLVILAVVIVIALIVVGVMGGIPSLGGGVSESAAKVALSSSKIGITAYSVDDTEAKLRLVNNNPGTIRINSINVGFERCQMCDGRFTLKAGEQTVFSCGNVEIWDPNQRYELPVVINYTELNADATYIQQGDDLQLVGKSGNLRQSIPITIVELERETDTISNKLEVDGCNNIYSYTASNGDSYKYADGSTVWSVNGANYFRDFEVDSLGNFYFATDSIIQKYSPSGSALTNISNPARSGLKGNIKIQINDQDQILIAYPNPAQQTTTNDITIAKYDSDLNYISNFSINVQESIIAQVSFFEEFENVLYINAFGVLSGVEGIFIYDDNGNYITNISDTSQYSSIAFTNPSGFYTYSSDFSQINKISKDGTISTASTLDQDNYVSGSLREASFDSHGNLYLAGQHFSDVARVIRVLPNGTADTSFELTFDVDQENYIDSLVIVGDTGYVTGRAHGD